MMHNTRNCPQVPGDTGGEAHDSRPRAPRVRGKVNLRARALNCQTTIARNTDSDKLNILTYNVCTLRTEEKLIELENALEFINWDVVGLAEVRRDGEDTLERSKNIFYYNGSGSQYGVGFLVSKRWKQNIIEFISYSDRIALLKFKITEKKILTIIQVYAPHSKRPDDELEEFYDLLNKACDEHRGTWTIVMGDFNAKLGKGEPQDNPIVIGPFGLGERNDRGKQLLNFAFGQSLSISNSFFYKKPQRRWTWFSRDGITKNEIDFCLASNRQMLTNVETINKIRFSSDHRPLRIVAKFNLKLERMKMIKNNINRIGKTSLMSCQDQFNLELTNSFKILDTITDNLEIQYNNIKNSIKKASCKVKPNKTKLEKLSNHTKDLIEKRLSLKFNTAEYRDIDKYVKRLIRTDIRNFNTNLVKTALEKNESLKVAKQGTEKGKQSITKLRDKNGIMHGERNKIIDICTDFYSSLYSDPSTGSSTVNNTVYSCSENIAPITGLEVHRALSSMKYSKSPGEDGITTEALKIGEPALLPHITNFFNSILQSGNFPKSFCHSNIILLHKKGDKSNISNYRPISLISHLYKTFIKVIEYRISGQLDLHQPPEQAGFRRGLSTTDHLHSLNQQIEKHSEFNLPIYLAFIDFSKAFDSIKHHSLFESLTNQNIEPTYIKLLRNIYSHSTAAIKLSSTGPSFSIEKGVKQGDPLSPKLFTATLEEVFKTLTPSWADKGIILGERRLTNLRFADDIVLFSSSATELGCMLNDLNQASLEVGLAMNMSKTKLMTNSTRQRLHIEGVEIEYVHEYVYLGQIVSFQARQEKEVARRIENAWRRYWSMKQLMKGELPLCLKRKLMDMCVLPILTYGAQTWSLTVQQRSKLEVCQRAMERSILGVRLSDRIRNSVLRSQTKIMDVTKKSAQLKWDWAGHVCRMPEDLWAKITTDWVPNATRPRGRPPRRWRDDLDVHLPDWPTTAKDRKNWKEGREAFALQWDNTG